MFITVEGPEGAGKTTQMVYMADLLRSKGLEVVTTKEPGGTFYATKIRELLLAPYEEESLCSNAELLLMFAARAQHVEIVIKPALAAGKVVLCDRFTDSTYAYQHGGRGIPYDHIEDLEYLVLKGFEPDLTFLMDLDVNVGMERATARGKLDRFEQEEMDFFIRVQAAFLSRRDRDPERFAVIQADRSIDEVKEQVKPLIELAAWRCKGKPGVPTLASEFLVGDIEVKIPRNLATFNSINWDELTETDKQKMNVMLRTGTEEQKRDVMAMITKG